METKMFNDWLKLNTINYYEPLDYSLPFALESLDINQLGYLREQQLKQMDKTMEGLREEVARENWMDMHFWENDLKNSIDNLTRIDIQFRRTKFKNEAEDCLTKQKQKQAQRNTPAL